MITTARMIPHLDRGTHSVVPKKSTADINAMVRRLLAERDWTQEELSKRLGYEDASSVSHYLAGRREWPHEKLEQIADIGGFSVFDFYLMPDSHTYQIRACIFRVEQLLGDLYRLIGETPPEG